MLISIFLRIILQQTWLLYYYNSLTNILILLTVAGPYFISRLPHTTAVIVTDSMTLKCTVVGSTSPMITWYHDLSVVSQEDHRVTITTDMDNEEDVTTSTLMIESVQPLDKGVYSCQASDRDGISTTETILSILGMFPILKCGDSSTWNLVVSMSQFQQISQAYRSLQVLVLVEQLDFCVVLPDFINLWCPGED